MVKNDILKNSGKSFCTKKRWENAQYQKFYDSRQKPWIPILQGKSRLQSWKKKIRLGPFWKIVPESNSFFSLNPKIFVIIEPLVREIVKAMRMFGFWCDEEQYFHKKNDKVDFHYYNIPPGLKDQFGESPTRKPYATKWMRHINKKTRQTILFLIDGGPRHFIVDQIFRFKKKYKLMKATVCLFDAYRPEYAKTLEKIKGGRFYASTCFDLNGKKIYDQCRSKELWVGKL